MEKEPKTYVVSVSLGSGCYRHIKISSTATLYELHEAILDAFEFLDDHMHAFFMDNKAFSQDDCYYTDVIEDKYRYTNQYRLDQVGLAVGKQFKYVFDFGDDWRFQCKVLKELREWVDEPEVIREKGKAPRQYEYEDDWDEEGDDVENDTDE